MYFLSLRIWNSSNSSFSQIIYCNTRNIQQILSPPLEPVIIFGSHGIIEWICNNIQKCVHVSKQFLSHFCVASDCRADFFMQKMWWKPNRGRESSYFRIGAYIFYGALSCMIAVRWWTFIWISSLSFSNVMFVRSYVCSSGLKVQCSCPEPTSSKSKRNMHKHTRIM